MISYYWSTCNFAIYFRWHHKECGFFKFCIIVSSWFIIRNIYLLGMHLPRKCIKIILIYYCCHSLFVSRCISNDSFHYFSCKQRELLSYNCDEVSTDDWRGLGCFLIHFLVYELHELLYFDSSHAGVVGDVIQTMTQPIYKSKTWLHIYCLVLPIHKSPTQTLLSIVSVFFASLNQIFKLIYLSRNICIIGCIV